MTPDPTLRRTSPRRVPSALVAALALAFAALLPSSPATADVTTTGSAAALTASSPALLPGVLSDADAERYRKIHALQKDGHWRAADRLIKALDNRLLMGHVLAQRYLHPTKYRSHYKELRDWLKHYADLPQAHRIYKLALRRKPAHAAAPKKPTYAVAFPPSASPPARYVSNKRRSPRQAAEARRLIALARRESLRDRPSRAYEMVHSAHALRVMDTVERDMAATQIATGFFFLGNMRKALANAAPAGERSGIEVPAAHWIAGLAAFHLGSYERAAQHFEGMAMSPRSARWSRTAASFWAARSHMYAEQPDQVTPWLIQAAEDGTTFYSLLARRILGREIASTGDAPSLTQEHVALLATHPAGLRALALLQTGDAEDAERELRGLARNEQPELAEALFALADYAGLPALALLTANRLTDDKARFAALYPVPRWAPRSGFSVDRALIYAFMRQESRFNTRAKSPAGARGLMQLMPGTAGYMAKTRFRGARRGELYDPAFNLELGQRYLDHLISHPVVGGDLLLLAAAYNGGPGNLSKWRREARGVDIADPLMFIETIPSGETRNFIERVLANLWIYRARLGQPSPSLDALAEGKRPIYKPQDPQSHPVAANARN